jgi:protein-S-isoprenylcysteine O-methyltransferase Ste14
MSLQLRIPPLIWFLLFGSLMWALKRVTPIATLVEPPANRAGWVLAAFGAGIAAVATLQFRRARTTINPHTPAKSSSLMSSGVFGYSRNPIYLGLSLALCGWAVVLGTLSPWAVLPLFVLVITRLQIEPEEAVLATLFGTTYADYCARVGRWFGRSKG